MEQEEVKYSRIESKEIRGLNVRNLIAIIGATIAIVSTVLFTKNSLESQIRDVKNDQATFGKISDMNFKIYDARFQSLQDQIDRNKRLIDDLWNKK